MRPRRVDETRRMGGRRWRVGSLGGAALLALSVGCAAELEGSGSNTNWLEACVDDSSCGEGLSCLCGLCTRACEAGCEALTDAVCAASSSGSRRALCGLARGGHAEQLGLCLPRCSEDEPCDAGSLCLDGSCLPLRGETSGCPSGAALSLEGGAGVLSARFGTLFSTELYVPVSYAEEPADWTEPAPPADVVARVVGASGEPVVGCRLSWLTPSGSGWAFPRGETTDEDGRLRARWVAGEAQEQELWVALGDEDERISLRKVFGQARSSAAAPQANDEALRSSEVSPALLWVSYPRAEDFDVARVTITPRTFPHHAFYAGLSLSGFFSGLQNWSSGDGFAEETPGTDRVLLASVWNTAETEATLLWQAEELECGSHDQGEGGLRCVLPSAWSDDSPRSLRLEARILALDESAPEYEALGYETAPCASPSGCTDLTLSFGEDAAGAPRRLVAYRYPSATGLSGLGGFVQPYARAEDQISCLVTPRYDVSYRVELGDSTELTPLPEARLSASYASFRNDVCANYGAWSDGGAIRLATGGPEALGTPQGPDDPGWVVPLE